MAGNAAGGIGGAGRGMRWIGYELAGMVQRK
jgi:hypothetical protein